METNTSSKRRGRPSKDFSWPTTPFTIADMVEQTSLSSVRIQQKIKLELQNGKVFKIDTRKPIKPAKGRPSTIYSTVQPSTENKN